MPRILLIGVLTFFSLFDKLLAQTPITIKNNHLYVDVGIEHGGKKHTIPAIIDTGCSYCVLDSTFAVDSCGVEPYEYNTRVNGAGGKKIQTFKTTLKRLYFAEESYNNIPCCIIDLKGIAGEAAPNLLIGIDVLKRQLWSIDLKNNQIETIKTKPKTNYTLKWKNHKTYPNTFLDAMVLEAKIAGKKALLLFDTGSSANKVPLNFEGVNFETIKVQTASIEKALSDEYVDHFHQQDVVLGKLRVNMDFTRSKTSWGYLNATIFMGKTIVLDFKKQMIGIIE